MSSNAATARNRRRSDLLSKAAKWCEARRTYGRRSLSGRGDLRGMLSASGESFGHRSSRLHGEVDGVESNLAVLEHEGVDAVVDPPSA